MAVKIQPTKKVPAKKIAVASVQKNKSISFDEEGNVIDEQETVTKPVKSEPKTITRKGIRPVVRALLLDNSRTDSEIISEVIKKLGDVPKIERIISVQRHRINSGKRCSEDVKKMKIKLPLVRLVRVSGKLAPAESIPKSTVKKIVLSVVKAPAKKIAAKKAIKK